MRDTFGVDSKLAGEIFQRQNDLRGAYRNSLRAGIELGRLLNEAKAQCHHGDFLPWLKESFDGTPRHAQNLMRLAVRFPDPASLPALSLRQALQLLVGKTPAAPPLPHERLSRRTVDRALRAIESMAERAKAIDAAFRREGLSPKHDAAKRARALGAAIGRLRSYLRDCAASCELVIVSEDER